MNKKTGCFLLLLGLYSIANAQLIVRGLVCDADTKTSIPDPIVGVKNKPLGILGDRQGSFTLQKELLAPSDSVEITGMGYQTLQVAAADLGTEPKTPYTTIAPFEIGSVTVSPRTQELKIGWTGSSGTPLGGGGVLRRDAVGVNGTGAGAEFRYM